MRGAHWATCLWPGLSQLALRGRWTALAAAVLAALGLNLALLSSFVWSELIGREARMGLWMGLGAVWVASAVYSLLNMGRQQGTTEDRDDDQRRGGFRDAVEHYLKGDWFQTQRILVALLKRDPRDLEARLMLATMLRHAGRLDEAGEQLGQLQRFEGTDKWELEIRREQRLLSRDRSETAQSETVQPSAEGGQAEGIEDQEDQAEETEPIDRTNPPTSVDHAA